MPFKSKAQQKFFHSKGTAEAGIKPKQVKEFDETTKGNDLPERAPRTKSLRRRAREKFDKKKSDAPNR